MAPPERSFPPPVCDELVLEDVTAELVLVEVAVDPAICEEVTAVGSSIDTLKHGISVVNCVSGTYRISAQT